MVDAKIDIFDGEDEPEGVMNVPGNSTNGRSSDVHFNTLDEPVTETIKRDLTAVTTKLSHVLFAKEKKLFVQEWDLWGPLFLCTFIAVLIQNNNGPHFAEVFIIMLIGSLIVTLNNQLLGGDISFFQSVCVLGYCLLPISVALVLCKIILSIGKTDLLFFLRLLITMTSFLWATYAATKFLGDSQAPRKKALGIYPICFFYFIVSWLIISYAN